jgi:hypothetical protein
MVEVALFKVTVSIDSKEVAAVGVTLLEAADSTLLQVPDELIPYVLKVYAVPAVKPETVIGLVADDPVIDPGVEIAPKEVAAPPVAAAVNVTVADSAPAVAVPIVGASTTSGTGVLPAMTLLSETLLVIVT